MSQTTEDIDAGVLDELFDGMADSVNSLTASDEVYLEFRETVDKGLLNANFDLEPGKSAAHTSNLTGRKFVDQPLRSHILNGAAFAARLNAAFRDLHSPNALTDDELMDVLAMFTCHDLHKSEQAQRRRATGSVDGTDKDIPDEELEYYIEQLQLNDLDTNVSFKDYKAAALCTEQNDGRHRAVSSKRFSAFRDWIRMLDAAAALSSPENINQLSSRLANLDESVSFGYHRIDDSKGITTNILNNSIAEYISSHTPASTIVYFESGVLYLTPDSVNLHEQLTATDPWQLVQNLSENYINHLHDEVDSFAGEEQVKNSLTGQYDNGYVGIGQAGYVLYGLDRTEKAVRSLVEQKATYADWSVYSPYKNAAIAAVSEGVVDTLPEEHMAAQALGIYFGTLENELFRPLRNSDRVETVCDIASALGLEGMTELVRETTSDGTWECLTPQITSTEQSHIANHVDVTEKCIQGRVDDGFKLVRTKSWAHVMALAFLNSSREDGTLRSELPLSAVLQDASDAIFESLYAWNSEWDASFTRGVEWDSSWTPAKKMNRFEQQLMGPFVPSTKDYIARVVSVMGKQLAEPQTNKTKLNEQSKKTQPHICMLCNDLLIGGTSLERDFKTSERVVGVPLGFSHNSALDADGGQPTSVVCSQCDVETTLRNSIHALDESDMHNYLFIAPDYYYSPADMAIQAHIRRLFKADSGYMLLEIAKEILNGDPSSRGNSINRILDAFQTDGDYTDYNEFIHNYDTAVSDMNSMGVYRLEPPQALSGELSGNQNGTIARWILDVMFAMVVSWTTASRVLLTDGPLPTTDFDSFNEMVKVEHAPKEVTNFIGGDTVSISRREDLGQTPAEFTFNNLTETSLPDVSTVGRTTDATEAVATATDGGESANLLRLAPTHTPSNDGVKEVDTLRLNTEFGVTLYKLASLLHISRRRHGMDVSRLTMTLRATENDFAGASMMLKGTDTTTDYNALTVASMLDTFTDYTISQKVRRLAEAAFEALPPRHNKHSNYEYERLFRVAIEEINTASSSCSVEELETRVTREVTNLVAKMDSQRSVEEQQQARDRVEEFVDVFMNGIFVEECDADSFKLRQREQGLASGYNAAIRRRQAQEFATGGDVGE